jgi:hypothetical protein
MAADLVRQLYRHREHGLLVDPGGWWLNRSVDAALGDPDTVAWFRETFEPLGRLPIDEFADQFRRLVRTVQERTGAHVLVFNTLTVEPRDETHNYQLRRSPEGLRRRRFHLALADLSRELGFHIVDVDRILKREGVTGQLDFAHFPEDQFGPLAAEVQRILTGLGVLGA